MNLIIGNLIRVSTSMVLKIVIKLIAKKGGTCMESLKKS